MGWGGRGWRAGGAAERMQGGGAGGQVGCCCASSGHLLAYQNEVIPPCGALEVCTAQAPSRQAQAQAYCDAHFL